MTSRLILTVESATAEQIAALYKQLDNALVGASSQPEVEILVQHAYVGQSPVTMPAEKPVVGLDGKPMNAPLPTTSGLDAR